MNKKKNLVYLLFVLVAIILCYIYLYPQVVLLFMLPGVVPNHVNKEIKLWIPDGQEELVYGKSFHLILENMSNKDIVFPSGYGMKIYLRKNLYWEEVYDLFSDALEEEHLYPKGETDQRFIQLFVKPAGFQNPERSFIIRVVVIGSAQKASNPASSYSSRKVGAYIDITLQP